jgi:hypothetical protein
MDALSATAATAAPTTDTTTTPATTDATAAKKSFSALFADAQKDLKSGEKLTKVDGHPYARIKGGERDAMCVNLSGNGRSGEAFDLISRGGHQFHVYGGKGADHVVVEVGRKPTAATTPAATTPAATTPATDGTTTTGTTRTTGTTGTTGTTTDDTTPAVTTPATGSTGSTTTGTTGTTKS